MFKILITIFAFSLVSTTPTFAAEKIDYNSNLCAEDSAVCRGLAIEIAKKDIEKIVIKESRSAANGSFLCPESNPECCPPSLQPVCTNYLDALVVGARAQLQLEASPQAVALSQDCPFGSEFCTPNCEGDFLKVWGCAADFPGFNYNPNPDPWPVCEPGEKHNSKGICIPDSGRCLLPNTSIRIPCDLINYDQQDNLVAVQTERTAPTPILINHLNDTNLRLQAAKQVLEDLRAAVNSAEEQVKLLSQ